MNKGENKMSKYTYRTGGYCDDFIKRYEVVKETEKQITILIPDYWTMPGAEKKFKERREAKRSSHQNHFDTFADAKAFLMSAYDGQIASYQSSLDGVKAKKQKINNLQEST
jgi:hypothetical protein